MTSETATGGFVGDPAEAFGPPGGGRLLRQRPGHHHDRGCASSEHLLWHHRRRCRGRFLLRPGGEGAGGRRRGRVLRMRTARPESPPAVDPGRSPSADRLLETVGRLAGDGYAGRRGRHRRRPGG